MSDNNDLLDRLEKILLIYERAKEMELKRAEVAAKMASDIIDKNRKSQMELMSFFNQFVTCNTPIKKEDTSE